MGQWLSSCRNPAHFPVVVSRTYGKISLGCIWPTGKNIPPTGKIIFSNWKFEIEHLGEKHKAEQKEPFPGILFIYLQRIKTTKLNERQYNTAIQARQETEGNAFGMHHFSLVRNLAGGYARLLRIALAPPTSLPC